MGVPRLPIRPTMVTLLLLGLVLLQRRRGAAATPEERLTHL